MSFMKHGLECDIKCGRALDFGCGLGRMTRALARSFDEVVGTDISDVMIAKARQLAREKNISFIQVKEPNLPFPSASFDFVFSTLVIQHIDEPWSQLYFAELCRMLKPQGYLCADIPSHLPAGETSAGPGIFLLALPRVYAICRSEGCEFAGVRRRPWTNAVHFQYFVRKC